ncbi:MAG: UDP-N-acetylmuramate dehydrogenase [Anaerovoracaceae bacterium]|nr:UDP-N-acetylmuramate dehydrogenase [Anaerovoracaceae bacterium]
MKAEVIEGLKNIITGDIITDADMRVYTSFRAGGRADILAEPADAEELRAALAFLKNCGEDFLILGNGTNVLIKDGGFRGAVIHLGDAFSDITVEGNAITAGCGALLSAVSKRAQAASLAGMEFASGIPGSIGGAVFMNAGAYGGEIKDIIVSADVITRGGEVKTVEGGKLGLGYRTSAVQTGGGIVLSATFGLEKGDREQIDARMDELAKKRNAKQPLQYPSAGSFFKRPEGYYAGKLIQDAGLKGLKVGGAQVSELHSGFVINTGGATAGDIISLMHIVQARVMDKFGVMLEPEVRIIGEDIEQ